MSGPVFNGPQPVPDHGPGSTVATLHYPIPAGELEVLTRALEKVYGRGLVADFADPRWLTIKMPKHAPARPARA